ncbi:MAG: DUF3455 domain-containing protein, partial [Chloroflexota bacterium]
MLLKNFTLGNLLSSEIVLVYIIYGLNAKMHNLNLAPNRYKLNKLILMAALLCWLIPLGGHLSAQDEPSPPDHLPDDQMLLLKTAANGVQIYVCGANVWDGPEYVWTLKGLDATLYDANGAKVGILYTVNVWEPTWKYVDGSKVVGQTVYGDSYLDYFSPRNPLLKAESNTGYGLLSGVDYVERIGNTRHLRLMSSCDKKHDGAEQRVDFTATYAFYTDASHWFDHI